MIGETSVEVKSISGSSRMRVRISSEDQLVSETPHLFLRIYRLAQADDSTPDASSLNQMVQIITQHLETNIEARLCFEKKLMDFGYQPLPDYDYPLITLLNTHTFRVSDEFPRLTRQGLPEGVIKVSYDIELEHLDPYKCDHIELLGEM